MTDDTARSRANDAIRLLDEPLIAEAFEETKAAYQSGLFSCDPKDDLGRFRYTEAMKIVERVQAHIKDVAEGVSPDVGEFEEPKPRFFRKF